MDSFDYALGLVCCAWVMGFAFDIYNTVTGSTKWLRWIRPVLDVIFWLSSAFMVYYSAYVTDDGQLRMYTFVLLLIGYGLYRFMAHRLVVRGAYGVIRVVRVIVLFVFRLIFILAIRPIILLFQLTWGIIRWLYRVGCLVEDGLFQVLRICLLVVRFPFRGLWPRSAPFLTKLFRWWEEFWVWLSNWLVSPSKGA